MLENGLQLVIEIKGQCSDDADTKVKAAERWVRAMNNLGDNGRWAYLMVEDPPALGRVLDQHSPNTKTQPLLTLDTIRSETPR